MRHPRRPVRLALAAAALLLARPLAAQTVDGLLLDAGTRAPVPRALIALLDASGRAVATTQTQADGRFALAAPAAGTYRVRAERVGRAATLSAPLALSAGETTPLELLARPEVVQLDALVVQAGERACSVRPDRDARVAEVWDEARKALASLEWARRNDPRLFEVRRFTRELDPATLTIRREEARTERTRHSTPFRAAPPEQLAEKGFVQADGNATVFLAPDAEVLLSDAFLDTHCFGLRRGADEEGNRVLGLTFEPVRGRQLPDVEGVLWLDPESAELKRVEYAYTGLGVRAQIGAEWGGRLDFARLPDGAWIVRRWSIRMPVVGTRRVFGSSLLARQTSEKGLVAVREEGAEVTLARGFEGQVVLRGAPPAGGTLVGTVWDSTRARPLADARVFLRGTPFEARTDLTGAFRLPGVPEGRYAVAFEHPRADTLVIVPAPVEVELKAAGEASVDLALGRPPRQVAAAEVRPDSAIALAAVEATGEVRRRRLENVGFYLRKRSGSGIFMDEEDFQRRSGARVVDMLSGIRGFFARPSGPNGHGFYQRRQNQVCFVPLYIDGRFAPVSTLLRVRAEDVEAVEIYEGHETPRQFHMPMGYVCGAIVVWLKAPVSGA